MTRHQISELEERTSDLGRDHYIPIGRQDLVRAMIGFARLTPEQTSLFRSFAARLESCFHQQFYRALRDLSEAYAAFDPDCIIVDLESEEEASNAEKKATFFRELTNLVDKANYQELSRADIDEALSAAKMFGIRLAINFDAFDHLSVYVRGRTMDQWKIRKWYRMFREEEVEVPIYRRLILVFQYVGDEPGAEATDGQVHLKIFKNIPTTDIDILLPESRVRLSLFDRGKILLPTVSGLSLTAYKIVKTSLLASLFTGIYGTLAFIVLVGGTLGYGVKSFFGYLRTKDKYQLHLTRHLYYQNLGNNKGVLFRMINDAEEQEFREALIAYFLLWQEGGEEGWTKEQLDGRAESWLREVAGIEVDFEDEDSLNKLSRLGLATVEHHRWQVVPLDQADQILTQYSSE
jgi:hypothetical protein